jgi:diketogulonate reductase-like aldo/keto reductase
MRRSVTLSNGAQMPMVGLGTYKMRGEECATSIPVAWQCGYRLYDTADIYQNQGAVTTALSKLSDSSTDYFVTSKISAQDQGDANAPQAIERILAECGGKVDLLLVHWPGSKGLDPADPENAVRRRQTWLHLESAYRAGQVKAIGVSNYEVCHLEEMRGYASVMPMVNQIELHPLYHRRDIVDYCREHGIFVQAYSSLARNKLLDPKLSSCHPILSALQTRYDQRLVVICVW